MNRAHEAALPTFRAAGFWHEDFLGVFMAHLPDGGTVTCGFDLNETGKWEAQHQGPEGEDLGAEDFDTPEAVIAYRDREAA